MHAIAVKIDDAYAIFAFWFSGSLLMHEHGLLNVIMSAVLGAEAEPASLAGSSMSALCITAVSCVMKMALQYN